MNEGVTESRFNMWRAVFALVHVDHKVTKEEQEFAFNYLEQVPFSPEQKQTLIKDLDHPQPVKQMFDRISEVTDRSDFFQFARMLCWCDGDYDAQEEAIFGSMKESHMAAFDLDDIKEELSSSRAAIEQRNLAEDKEFEELAEKKLGLVAFLKGMARL